MTTTLTTVDGATVSQHKAAFDHAADLILDAGFTLVGGSQASRSLYFSRPGNSVVLRLADHDNHHPNRNAYVVELRLTQTRENVVTTMEYDGEDGEIETVEETEYMTVILETPARIARLVVEAVAEYDAVEAK